MTSSDEYRIGWASRVTRERAQVEERRVRALAALPALTRLLVTQFGAGRLVLFGSLARGDFGLRSDIDLLVAGVPPGQFFDAAAAADRLAGVIPVDLVAWETATEPLLAAVAVEGRVLHER